MRILHETKTKNKITLEMNFPFFFSSFWWRYTRKHNLEVVSVCSQYKPNALKFTLKCTRRCDPRDLQDFAEFSASRAYLPISVNCI